MILILLCRECLLKSMYSKSTWGYFITLRKDRAQIKKTLLFFKYYFKLFCQKLDWIVETMRMHEFFYHLKTSPVWSLSNPITSKSCLALWQLSNEMCDSCLPNTSLSEDAAKYHRAWTWKVGKLLNRKKYLWTPKKCVINLVFFTVL